MWKQDIKKKLKKNEIDTQVLGTIRLNCEIKLIYTFFLQWNHLTKIKELKQSKHD